VRTSGQQEQWVLRAQCDDREALELLLGSIQVPLHRYLRGIVGRDDALDAIDSFRKRVYIAGWVVVVGTLGDVRAPRLPPSHDRQSGAATRCVGDRADVPYRLGRIRDHSDDNADHQKNPAGNRTAVPHLVTAPTKANKRLQPTAAGAIMSAAADTRPLGRSAEAAR
jgi:hypothetical protein